MQNILDARNTGAEPEPAAPGRSALERELLDEMTAWSPRDRGGAFKTWHRHALSLVHLNVLTALEAEGPLSMSRLAEAMDVSDASATGIVDRMEKRASSSGATTPRPPGRARLSHRRRGAGLPRHGRATAGRCCPGSGRAHRRRRWPPCWSACGPSMAARRQRAGRRRRRDRGRIGGRRRPPVSPTITSPARLHRRLHNPSLTLARSHQPLRGSPDR